MRKKLEKKIVDRLQDAGVLVYTVVPAARQLSKTELTFVLSFDGYAIERLLNGGQAGTFSWLVRCVSRTGTGSRDHLFSSMDKLMEALSNDGFGLVLDTETFEDGRYVTLLRVDFDG